MPHAYDARVLRLALHGKKAAMQRPTHLHSLISLSLGVLLLCSTVVRDATALPSGLLAWWSGDSNANDVSGNGHNAILAGNAVAGVPGLIGGAFQFDGTADFVSTPLTLPSKGTIDLWVKPADLTGTIYGIFGTLGLFDGNDRLWLNARGDQGGLGIDPHNLVVNVGYCCLNEIVVPSPLLPDTWTHLALTFDYDHDTYALYINGALAGTSTTPPGPDRQKPSQKLDFGGHQSNFGQNYYWNGLMDEVHVFDHVLAPEEIEDLATPVIFTGFFPPISNLPVVNVVQAGQAIPVKFSLGGNQGLNIFAPGYPQSQGVVCDSDDPINDVQPTETAGGSGLTYDPTTDTYTYVWKTKRPWRNSCRTLLLQLINGLPHTADFRFK